MQSESPVPPIAESPECGTEKVWLCCETDDKFCVCRDREKPECDGKRSFWITGRWLDTIISAETARLIHPSHTLQPGECCEVPARDADGWLEDELRSYKNMVELGTRIEVDGERYLMVPERYIPLTPEEAEAAFDAAPAIPISDDELDEIVRRVTAGKSAPVPSAPSVDESEGPRWARTKSNPSETFLMQFDESDMWYGRYPDGTGYTRRVTEDEDYGKMPFAETFVDPEAPTESAHLAARERACELGLIEAGPRWEVIPEGGVKVGEFICCVGDVDAYVADHDGQACLWHQGRRWENTGYVKLSDCLAWKAGGGDWATETLKTTSVTAYDTALSAGKLPPHPRWAKPTPECDTFLCWGEVGGESRDFWWGSDRRIHSVCEFDSGIADPESRYYAIFASGYQSALARARELRLPQRARIATLRAARDAATADLEAAERELREMGGGA